MLDLEMARKIKDELDKRFNGEEFISFEDIVRMEMIPKSSRSWNPNILAIQNGDMTLLIWVRFNKKEGMIIMKIQVATW